MCGTEGLRLRAEFLGRLQFFGIWLEQGKLILFLLPLQALQRISLARQVPRIADPHVGGLVG
jgi:hypothetical protein